MKHPLSREHFSLKIDVRDQTIWNCILELQLFYSSQMKLKLAGLFFQKSTRWRWAQSKMHQIKKITPRTEQTFRDRQLCFYVKKLFVSEKTQKSELCHFSQEIYVIKFSALRTRSYARGEKFDDINLLRKMTKFTFLCFFTNK